MTNFDKIKNMSAEELARVLVQYDSEEGTYLIYGKDTCNYDKELAIKSQIEWLESEAE